MSVEKKYRYTKPHEAVVLKDWAAGTKEIINTTGYIYDDGIKVSTLEYPPAWLKSIIDEPLVNAIDHYIRCYSGPHKVSKIAITFDVSGTVIIYNDGPGIETDMHPVAGVRVPHMLFGMLNQGEHMEKADDSITGGTNGIGAKLGNCFSNKFLVETCSKGMFYIQMWENHMDIVQPPMVRSVNEIPAQYEKTDHTKLIMAPDYTGLFSYKEFNKDIYNKLNQIVHMRMLLASSFINYANNIRGTKSYCDFMYNSQKINNTLTDIAKHIYKTNNSIISTHLKPSPSNKIFTYPWELVVIADENTHENLRVITNVNGMVVTGGKHVDYIYTLITKALIEILCKELSDKKVKLSKKAVMNNLVIFVNCHVPGARWKGQAKDLLDIPAKYNDELNYNIDKGAIDEIYAAVKDTLLDGLLNKREKKEINAFDKNHKPAQCINSKNYYKFHNKSRLLLCEGNSAQTQIDLGVNEVLGNQFYGTMAMRGVILNVRKETKVINIGGKELIKKLSKMENSKFIKALFTAIGIDEKFKYDPSTPSYEREMKKLKYGGIIMCVDQDEDGMNILGLFINIFDRLWPKLLAGGYISWWQTPIIRAYPTNYKNKVIEFYSDTEYRRWLKTNNIDINSAIGKPTDNTKKIVTTSTGTNYTIKYYKGLGTHDKVETIHMTKGMNGHLFVITTTDFTKNNFEIFYGKAPSERKKEFSKPFVELTDEEMSLRSAKCKVICDEFLKHEVSGSQRYNISRKLDNVIDGMNASGRKIFAGCRKRFNKNNNEMRVSQLAGYISLVMSYHHGEDSLVKSIRGKAFTSIGGKQLPMLLPIGNFGNRMCGGADAASARYIYTKFNKHINDIIYPIVDEPNLKYTPVEGVICEPDYYVPIIPAVCTESIEIPAHGWKLEKYARDVFDVIKLVKAMITINENISITLRPYTYKWNGRIDFAKGKEASFGTYKIISENRIVITELPLRVWTNPYLEFLAGKMQKDKIIKHFNSQSTDDKINITIDFYDGMLDYITTNYGSVYSDGVEEYFKLYKIHNRFINLLGPKKEIIEFTDYNATTKYWFPFRKELYRLRIEREIILFELKILYLENKLRYVSTETRTARVSSSDQILYLENNNYNKFNTAALGSNKHISTENLRHAILVDNAKYDYLLSVSDMKKSTENILKTNKKLTELREKFKEYLDLSNRGRFIGAEIWLQELTKLEEEITRGRKTNWLYEENGKYNL